MAIFDDLIGAPFRYGGRGPTHYDCYGLLMELYRRDGIVIPDFDTPEGLPMMAMRIEQGLAAYWRRCEMRPGAGALFLIKGIGAHVGYVIDSCWFVHTWEKSGGVCAERLEFWRRKLVGYYELAPPVA